MEEAYLKYIEKIQNLYDDLLISSFSKDFWYTGKYDNHRIKWTDTNKVLSSLNILDEKGIYIWGHNQTPIYIGKTERSFKKRFKRYVFSNNSQCKIAELYRQHINDGGRLLNYTEIIDKYGLKHKSHKSRAIGIKSFGECNSNDIWFILLPFNKEFISGLEIALIKAGNNWNIKNGFNSLINLDK